MDLGLAGKTVIVTGGGSNIGRGIVLAFAKEGSNVVIAEIDASQGQKVEEEARALGGDGRTIFFQTDVTKIESVEAMVKKALDEFKAIDVLVNNVGWTRHVLFIEKLREDWQKEIDLNFWGVINCTRAVLGHMIEQRSGKVINISSDSGRMGEYQEAVYAGCKGGVIAMSKALAKEAGRYGITFNCICPGMTPAPSREDVSDRSMWAEWGLAMVTPEVREKAAKLYPLRKLGTPEDTANAVLFFASNLSNYITGQTLSVSGGYTMM